MGHQTVYPHVSLLEVYDGQQFVSCDTFWPQMKLDVVERNVRRLIDNLNRARAA